MIAWTSSLLCAMAVVGCSYSRHLSVLSRSEALDDIQFLVAQVESIHPAAFTRVEEQALREALKEAADSLEERNQRKTFTLVIARLLAMFQDDHTRLASSPDFHEYVRSGGILFPVVLRCKGDEMEVVGWASKGGMGELHAGDVLAAIDGISMESLVRQLSQYVSAETEWQKRNMVALHFQKWFWYSGHESDRYELELISEGRGKHVETVLAGKMEAAELGRQSTLQQGQQSAPRQEWPYSFCRAGQVCHLRLPSFWVPDLNAPDAGGPTYRRFASAMDALLDEMKRRRTRLLIADLRGNGGGDSALGNALLRRVTGKPFRTGTWKWRYSRAYRKAMLIYGLESLHVPSWMHLENILDLRRFRWGPHDSQLEPEKGSEAINGPGNEGGDRVGRDEVNDR